MSKTALLLIDIQNDYFSSFSGAKWALSGTEAAAENAALLLSVFREKNLPVIHVRHQFTTPDAPFFAPDTEGAQIHASVTPQAGETVVVKSEINSFKATELDAVLKQKGVERLVIVGAMSHMCIDAVVRAAADLGYECHLAHDACATLDLEFNGTHVPAHLVHAAFMAALEFGYSRVDSAQNLAKLAE